MKQSGETMDEPDWITVREASRRLSVSEKHLRRQIEAGAVPVRRVGRTVRVDRNWVKTPIPYGGTKIELE